MWHKHWVYRLSGYSEIYGVLLIRTAKWWMCIFRGKHGGAAAKRFFNRLLRSHGDKPRKIVTDKLEAMELHIVS